MDRRMQEIEGGFERELGALLGSVNFSGYTDRARLRSDDLAVRSAASRYVLDAKECVSSAISGWWNSAAGEPTRENPFPKPEVSKKLREMRAFEQSLAEIETAIRGATAPDFDAVWNVRNDGASALQALLNVDTMLVARARALAEAARAITAQTLAEALPFAALAQPLADVESVVRERKAALSDGRSR